MLDPIKGFIYNEIIVKGYHHEQAVTRKENTNS